MYIHGYTCAASCKGSAVFVEGCSGIGADEGGGAEVFVDSNIFRGCNEGENAS